MFQHPDEVQESLASTWH